MKVFAWIFGVSGIIANLVIYQQKNRKNLLMVKLGADVLWTLHYAFLSAWSGAAVCGIGIIRELIFLNNQSRWAKSKLWLVLFLICAIISAIFTWKNVFSVLPACASLLSVVSFWIGKPKLTRIFQLPISVTFLIYDIMNYSHTGMISEIMTIISIIIVLYRTAF